MAVTIVGGSPVVFMNASTTATAVTPTLPSGTVSGNRVFIIGSSVTTVAAPSGWTTLLASTSLGGGTAGFAAGPRFSVVFYRDYDGVWTMPSVIAANGTNVALAVGAVSMACGAGETFSTPLVTTGQLATAATAYSAAGSSIGFAAGMGVLLHTALPGSATTASPALTAAGNTFGGFANSVASAGASGNNGAVLTAWTTTVTTGATAAPTHALTLGTARTGGTAFVLQASTAALPAGTLAVETWPGASGAAWPAKWTTAISGAGVANQTGSGQGRLTSVATSAYASGDKAYLTGIAATRDLDITMDVAFTVIAEQYFNLVLRGPDSASATVNADGYYLQIYPGSGAASVEVGKQVSGTYSSPPISPAGLTIFSAWTANVAKRLRFRAVADTLQCKFWDPAGAEPAAWLWTGTDTTFSATTGRVWMSEASGAALVARTALVSNLTVTDGAGAVAVATPRRRVGKFVF